MTVTNNIYHKQIKYHVFNAVMNSELTELVPIFTIRPAFPTSVKKVNISLKNLWRTWGPALPTLLADLLIFCPLGPIGPTNFRNSADLIEYVNVAHSIGCGTLFKITCTCGQDPMVLLIAHPSFF
jgi:hypothetical protein